MTAIGVRVEERAIAEVGQQGVLFGLAGSLFRGKDQGLRLEIFDPDNPGHRVCVVPIRELGVRAFHIWEDGAEKHEGESPVNAIVHSWASRMIKKWDPLTLGERMEMYILPDRYGDMQETDFQRVVGILEMGVSGKVEVRVIEDVPEGVADNW